MDPRRVSAIARLAEEARAAGKAIRAYHGSPHSFSRFDFSKIGTGEGAQAYGHGLYFAGNEGVARTYKNISPAVPSGPTADAIKEAMDKAAALRKEADEIYEAMRLASETRGTLSAGWGTIRSVPPDVQQSLMPRLQEINKAIAASNLEVYRLRNSVPGHMYEVELGVPEEALLDWDAPIGSQMASRINQGLAADLAEEAQRVAYLGPQTAKHREVLNRIASGEVGLATGDFLYRAAGRYDPPSGPEGWSRVTNTVNDSITNQARASERLLDAGIPGIRYLDAGSRSAGHGTRNYVMFPGTEDHIRILRKYGLLAPMALPALQEGE